MKHLELFENFDSQRERRDFISEIERRRSESNNSTASNLEDIIKDANSIRLLIKEGTVDEVLNLLSSIIDKGLCDKKIPSLPGGVPSKTILYYYLLYIVESGREDIVSELYFFEPDSLDEISGKLTDVEKKDLLVWLEKSRKIGQKEPFYEIIDRL